MANEHDERIKDFGLFLETFSRLEQIIIRSLEQRAGLPGPWFEVLLSISRSEAGRLKMNELAERLFLTTGGITRLIDRMGEAGLVIRQACPSDRRVQWIALTDQGRAKFDEALPIHLADLSKYFTGALTPAEFESFMKALEKLRVAARNATNRRQESG